MDDRKTNMSEDQASPSSKASLLIPFQWNGYDVLCLGVLIFLAVFSRFWVIQFPRNVVFSEENQIHLTNCYINGTFVFDESPPLGSIILAKLAYFGDYNLSFTPPIERGYVYPAVHYVSLRSIQAFFSAICVPVSYLIVRSFGGALISGLSAGIFCLLEPLLIAVGRHFFLDGIVHLFVCLTVLFTALLSHVRPDSDVEWLLAFLQSFFLGCSIASSLPAFGLLIFVLTINRKSVKFLILNLTIPIIVFLGAFCWAVWLLRYESPDSVNLSPNYRQYLSKPGQKLGTPDHGSVLWRATELISLMFKVRDSRDTQLMSTHPENSGAWFWWPVMGGKWFVLWSNGAGRVIAAFGNLAVWWFMALIALLSLAKMVLAKGIYVNSEHLSIGFFASWLFFAFGLNDRGICDFSLAVFFGIWMLVMFIDEEANEYYAGFIFSGLILASAILFILWGPLLYGYEGFNWQLYKPYFAR